MVGSEEAVETLTLLFDRLAVKVDAAQETWSGTSIYKTDKAKADIERPRGTVVAVGPGKCNDDGVLVDMQVQVGDRVIIQKYGAQNIEVDGVELLVTEQKQVIAILNRVSDREG